MSNLLEECNGEYPIIIKDETFLNLVSIAKGPLMWDRKQEHGLICKQIANRAEELGCMWYANHWRPKCDT